MAIFHHYFLAILLLVPLAHSTTPSNTTTYVNFIAKSCNVTTYSKLCTKTLTPYAAKVKTNSQQLCKTALSVAINSARNCSATVSKLGTRKDITRVEARATKDCIGDLKDAIYELKETLTAMGHLKDADSAFQWSNAKTYASAAITDAETCVDELLEGKLEGVEVKGCVNDVEQHISNALALINHLF